MTGKNNRFGIGPIEVPNELAVRRSRDPGPMGVAVRESASSAQESSDALVEQRRQNASDAKEFRAAREAGRVLLQIATEEIAVSALPRDRLDLDAASSDDAMEELKASIRERGQREPIEVFPGANGNWELKAGWRRLTAIRQLRQETGDPRFEYVLARAAAGSSDRADLYLDMVEENVIREDLSFAEMAHVAIALADDPEAGVASVDDAVGRLYRALHKVKRSYIKAFVGLVAALGSSLRYPKAVSRDLGVDVARRLASASVAEVEELRGRLSTAESADDQTSVLRQFLKPVAVVHARKGAGQKFEFRVGQAKVTARNGEVRIKAGHDFASIDRSTLERAVQAFQAVLNS